MFECIIMKKPKKINNRNTFYIAERTAMKLNILILLIILSFTFNAHSDESIKTISSPTWIKEATLTDNGDKIVSRGKNLYIYDRMTKAVINHIPYYVYAVNNSEKYYISQVPEEGSIQLRQLDNQKLIKEFTGFSNRIYPHPNYLVRNPERREQILTTFKRTSSIVFSSNGQYMAACSISEFMVRIWNIRSGELIKELDVKNNKTLKKFTKRTECKNMVASSDGKYLLVDARGYNYGSGILLEFETGKVKGAFR